MKPAANASSEDGSLGIGAKELRTYDRGEP
jgi:hypothetical protein